MATSHGYIDSCLLATGGLFSCLCSHMGKGALPRLLVQRMDRDSLPRMRRNTRCVLLIGGGCGGRLQVPTIAAGSGSCFTCRVPAVGVSGLLRGPGLAGLQMAPSAALRLCRGNLAVVCVEKYMGYLIIIDKTAFRVYKEAAHDDTTTTFRTIIERVEKRAG